MSQSQLIGKLRAQRTEWVDLTDKGDQGERISFVRPPEVEWRSLTGGVTLEHVRRYCNGWAGFTEATVLGESVGSSDPIEFDADLCAEILSDRGEWLGKVANQIVESVNRRFEERRAALGN